MINPKNIILACLTCVTAASTAQAQEVGDYTVGAGLSTFGGNLEATYQYHPTVRFRGALMGGFSYDGSEKDDQGNEFDLDANISAVALLTDFYPYRNGWRISGGLVFNTSELNGKATANGGDTITVNGVDYNAGSIETKAVFEKDIAPMVSTGYDYNFADNWMLSGEIGAIYTGGIDLTVTSDTIPQSEINADSDISEARKDASDLTFYPYIGVSVSYRF